jgi:glycosyltransferase involved in cell wall biosynthesis
VLTNIDQIGGILQWTQTICAIFEKLDVDHTVIKKVDSIDIFNDNSEIIINNYYLDDFFNNIKKIKDKHIKLYYVVHSTVCPNNIILDRYFEDIDVIICVAEYIKTCILKVYPRANVYILNNYVLNEPNINTVRKSSEMMNFIFVGRISSEKNILMLLYAFSHIDKTKWKLNIYGECFCKKYEDMINRILDSEKIRDNVIFNGYVFDKNIIYNDCDYLILPSISEGASYCILEALSYGVPVIACSKVGDTSIIIDNKNGLLFSIDGLSSIENNKLYLNDYSNILLNVGYCKAVMIYQNLRTKSIIPPRLQNRYSPLFENNIKSMSDVINKAISKKIIIKPQIHITKDKYIDQLANIFKINKNEKICAPKKYPMISVIIPVFNRRDKILATIKSLNDQIYPNLEIIIVDDGSTDDCYSLFKNDKYIKYIKLETNRGCWYARNIGLEHARGEYILFHDADDISNKNKIMVQYDYITNLDLLLCGTLMYRTHINNFDNLEIDKIDAQIELDKKNNTIKHNLQCCKKILGFATFLYKKSLFGDVGKYNEMKKGTDADWLARYMKTYEDVNDKTYEQLHQYMSINRFGKKYMIIPNVLYYSTEFDKLNITNV